MGLLENIGVFLIVLSLVNTLCYTAFWVIIYKLGPGESPKNYDNQKYIWDVYTGLAGPVYGGILAAAGFTFYWVYWWVPFAAGLAGFLLPIVSALLSSFFVKDV